MIYTNKSIIKCFNRVVDLVVANATAVRVILGWIPGSGEVVLGVSNRNFFQESGLCPVEANKPSLA